MFTQPKTGIDFFGRDSLLQVLNKRANDLAGGFRQNVAITGQMLCGKTSLLQHFLQKSIPDSLFSVYVEVNDSSFNAFAQKFIGTVLLGLIKKHNIEHNSDETSISNLLNLIKSTCPKVVNHVNEIKKTMKKRKYADSYSMLLNITSVIKQETGFSCIVVLDEFHNMERFRIKNPFFLLGRVIMVQKDTLYIVTSSQRKTIQRILSEKLSLLFGNFEVVELEGFDRQTAYGYVRSKVGNITISDYYIDYILNLSQRKPFYLESICRAIKDRSASKGVQRVNVELLKSIFTKILYDQTGIINQILMNHVYFLTEKSKRKIFLDILIALSCGNRKLKDIASYCKSDPKNISKKIEELIEYDFVVKCGVFYRIQDRLFDFWLRNVYLQRQTSLVSEENENINIFSNILENDIETYLIEYNKNVLDRVKELFELFNGELVGIDTQVKRIPSFSSNEILRYRNDVNYLFSDTGNKFWISKIKMQRTDELDVLDFIEKTIAKKETVSKTIFIALGGIDENALLLAKQKKIWVWDLNTINNLLRIFNKQDII